MNFRWSNICVLQFLMVLKVNGLKLVPADRTVIKQNGTTRTISRYFLLPQNEPNGIHLGNSITTDAGFAKFLQEFEKKQSARKRPQSGAKKVDRYRIYIKRKLKKNPNSDIGKSGNVVQSPKNKPETVSKSTSTENIEISTRTTEPSKTKTLYITPPAPTPTDDQDEYVVTKKQIEITGTFPKLVMGQKPPGIVETTQNIVELKNPHKILLAAAAAEGPNMAQKPQLGKSKEVIEEDSEATIHNLPKPIANVTLIKDNKPINESELNLLYGQLYGKYMPEIQTKPNVNIGNDDESQEANVNAVKDQTEIIKQNSNQPNKGTTIKKLLTALHESPEKFPDQASIHVNNHPEHYDVNKNPLEGKEIIEKSVEMNYDETESTQPISVVTESFGTSSPSSIKTQTFVEDDVLTLSDLLSKTSSPITDDHYSNTEHGRNPLESYFLKYGHREHDGLFDYPSENVGAPATSTNISPSYVVQNLSPIIEHSESSRFPTYFYTETKRKPHEYDQESKQHSGFIEIPPSLDYNQASVELSNPMGNIPGFDFNFSSTENTQTLRNPSSLNYDQVSNAYSESIKSPPILSQGSIEYLKSIGKTPATGYNQASTEYLDTINNAAHQVYKPTENEYSETMGTPSFLGYQEETEYSDTSRPSIENTPNSASELNVEYTYSSPENSESSSISSFTNSDQYNSTDENKLRGGSGNEWISYQEVTPDEEHISRNPNLDVGSNLVQIGSGNEVINFPGPINYDLATMCPECFKRIHAELLQNVQTAGIDNSNVSILKLFKESPLFSYLLAQNQYHKYNQGSSSSSINTQGIVQFLQNLEAQNQQSIQLSPEKDQSLIKILEIVLKGNEGEPSTNVQESDVSNIHLFTIENIMKVLEALETQAQIQPQNDIEISNLYKIMKLIFETAKKQMESGADDNSGALWFTQLNGLLANPIIKYVYNLMQQTWLQEIMLQLYNNNFNLNVIRNPRWASYLGAWRLPMKLINPNAEYVDQNDFTTDYNGQQGQSDYYQEAISINPQGDANVILAFLKKYLMHAQYYAQNGGRDYYRLQTEVFSRIAAYLRQRGYAVRVIETLMRKLLAVLTANRALVTVARPTCMTRH